jgi:hypothetical protein
MKELRFGSRRRRLYCYSGWSVPFRPMKLGDIRAYGKLDTELIAMSRLAVVLTETFPNFRC